MLSNSSVSKIDSLLGLDSAKRIVRKLVADTNSVHGVLLYGASGSGKSVLAEELARAWLCKSPSAEGADGTCKACGAFERSTNPDFLRIAPDGKSRIITVGSISNDDPKDDEPVPLISFFRTYPLYSRLKVALIESADRMNSRASNALLKTLEEPHPHARLILTTDTVGAILPTILSRCLAIACESPRTETLTRVFPQATPREIRLAEGTPGQLTRVLEHRAQYNRLADFAESLINRHPGDALVLSEELRSIADGFEKIASGGVRAANTETLQLLAICLARDPQAPPEWTHYVAEAHQRIIMNGQPGIVFDALISRLLTHR